MPMTSWQARRMRKLGIVLLLAVTASGCIVRANGRMNPVASLFVTGVAVAVVANAVVEASNPPPPAVDVGYYGYARPGYVWVNGHQSWNGNAWVWTPGYYQGQRQDSYWVQGTWETRDNQYAYVDGYWAEPRPGYVYVDGYYDNSNNGYVWRSGSWETERSGQVYVQGSWSTSGNSRQWNRGGWQSRPASYNGAVNGSAGANGGVSVTPRGR